MIGRTLAHYELLEQIGAGGMGEVYLAHDTTLDRKVALKVLPPELAENEERRARFQREAKTIAALNHPNIITVHSVEEDDGVHFITMELVKGKTLAELLPTNGFPLDEFFEIGVPLADAVAAAHEAGIVHRDLKLANVMLTEDGRVKVLDFGLAQGGPLFEVEGDSESPTVLKTREGVLAGTLHYMSPEQAEGKRIDHRSDIFSLGVIFYEMLTGERPFIGETPASVLSSVLKDAPRPLTLAQQKVPRSVERHVMRCLAKDRRSRYQSALDLKLDLDDARNDGLEAGKGTSVPEASSAARRPPLALAAAIAIAVGLGSFILGSNNVGTPTTSVPKLTNPRQLTARVGVEAYPTWSPDGSRIAYSASPTNERRSSDIWVVQADGGPAVNLTQDYDGFDGNPSWSPDGSQIAFSSSRDGGGCFVIPALGGPARKVVEGGSRGGGGVSAPQWSRGNELACVVQADDFVAIRVANLQSGVARDVELEDLPGSPADLAWSGDARWFAFVAQNSPEAPVTDLFVTPADGGDPIRLTDGKTNVWGPTFRPSGELCYVSNRAGSMDLWCQKLRPSGGPDGEPEAVTVGIGMHGRAIFSPNGDRLAYSRGGLVAHMWRVPILDDRPATWFDAEQLTFEDAFLEYVDVSYDGNQVAFSSDRSGNHDIWIMPADASEAAVQLTTDPTPDWAPAWSPDGSEIAFYAFRSGNRDIWVAPVELGPARHLVDLPGAQYGPRWSPDGETIVFWGGGAGIRAISHSGGEIRTVAPRGSVPDWSRDGTSILYTTLGEGSLSLTSPDGQHVEQLPGVKGRTARWAPDGKTIYYVAAELDDIRSVTLADGSIRKMTDLRGRPGQLGSLALATDGHYLYFTWRQDRGDLWTMDVVQE